MCDCQAIGWFLTYGKLGFNSASLASVGKVAPRDDVSFIQEVFRSAGRCIECYREDDCRETRETVREFAEMAVRQEASEAATCHGVVIKNYDIEINSDIKDSTKSLDNNYLVKNERLVGDSESAERLTENLIQMNDSSIVSSCVKLQYSLMIFWIISCLN